MNRRSRAEVAQDRADLLAALVDAEERPVKAPDLIAAAHGTTVAACPDLVWARWYREGWTDLLAMRRTGVLVTSLTYAATYAIVDLPGSKLDQREREWRLARDDEDDLRRQMAGWVEA